MHMRVHTQVCIHALIYAVNQESLSTKYIWFLQIPFLQPH